MGFDICLIYHIKPILITKLIPKRIIRVMRTTDGIHMILFHQTDVLNHRFPGNGFSLDGIMFMTIHPLNQDRFAVNQQLTIFDFNPPETDAARCPFYFTTLWVLENNKKSVAVWNL